MARGRKKYDTNLVSPIKRCPFCGGIAVVRLSADMLYYVSCQKCGCRTPAGFKKELAVLAWNRRDDEEST